MTIIPRMKLRIKENSIRLRLTQGEVNRLAETGCVEETIDFGTRSGGRFVYALRIDNHKQEVCSSSERDRIIVFIPETLARNWIETEQVGIDAEQQIENGRSLRLTVEKDFACLHPRQGEDETDSFPNPLTDKNC